MTYRPSTEPGPARSRAELTLEATRYLHELGIDPEAGKVALADTLYKLVGPDSKRLGTAFALLELVEACFAAGARVDLWPAAHGGESSVGYLRPETRDCWDEIVEDGDLGAACRRLLEALKDGAP